MSLFNDYKNGPYKSIVEPVARWCSNLVFGIIDWFKGKR
jgi:hypothetical protein